MNPLKKWIIAIRAPFFTGIAMPIIFGTALAYYETGTIHWLAAVVTLLGGVFAQAAANLSNDYFDHKTTDDDINKSFTPFSGGSRVIQNKIVSAKGVLTGAFAFYALALACGIYLTTITPGYWILYLAIAGFIGGFFYTATRYAFSYNGLGELMILINFGILPVMGAYYVQTGMFSWSSFVTSFPIGFLITAILYINEYPDYEADKSVAKNHLVVRWGKKGAAAGYYFLIFGSYIALILAVVLGYLTPWALIAFLGFPVALKTVKTFRENYDKVPGIIPAQAGTIQIHMMTGLLLSIGTVAGALI